MDLMPSSLKKSSEVGYNCAMHAKTLPEPILVNTQAELRKLIDVLSRQQRVAVDTEANSLYAYREKVCLIQFSIPGTDYLVDPLALNDLSGLGPVFNNPEIEKIFHAAEYDLIILKRDFGFYFDRLFDTMLSARILGYKSVGLRSILNSHFGVYVNKKFQRANWGRRPLPREMLRYAQLDTHYLIPLRDTFKSELESQNRWQLAQEDFRRACKVDLKAPQTIPENCWRINGVRDLSSQQVAILHELCHLRDQKARTLDRPLFKVINDKSLLNIAVARPGTLSALERVPGVSHKQVQWIGDDLLLAVQKGQHKKPPPRPRRARPSDQYLDRVDSLRSWRKTTAQRMSVPSDVVLPKDLLYTLAERNPRTPQEVEDILLSVPWRFNKFGDETFYLLRASE
jgi:ribonuclease D